jgi:hypothetical protein
MNDATTVLLAFTGASKKKKTVVIDGRIRVMIKSWSVGIRAKRRNSSAESNPPVWLVLSPVGKLELLRGVEMMVL